MAAKERRSNNARAGKERGGSSDVMVQHGAGGGMASAANDTGLGRAPDLHNEEARRAEIALAAYYNAERRGFGGNRELDDWLQAEREVLTRLKSQIGRLT